jgi:hypothetical protein
MSLTVKVSQPESCWKLTNPRLATVCPLPSQRAMILRADKSAGDGDTIIMRPLDGPIFSKPRRLTRLVLPRSCIMSGGHLKPISDIISLNPVFWMKRSRILYTLETAGRATRRRGLGARGVIQAVSEPKHSPVATISPVHSKTASWNWRYVRPGRKAGLMSCGMDATCIMCTCSHHRDVTAPNPTVLSIV